MGGLLTITCSLYYALTSSGRDDIFSIMFIPENLSSIPYNPEVNPDNPPSDFSDLSAWSNCLIYAYAILRHNNLSPPILWSRELWDDEVFTEKVEEYREWDILLFWNNIADAYWWHIGLSLWSNKLIHLSKEVGIPEVTTYPELIERWSYKYLLGAKRLK